MLEESAQIVQRVLNRHQSGNLLILTLRLLRCIPNDWSDSREDQYLIGITSKGNQPCFHITVERLRFFQCIVPGEDGVRFLSGVVFADLGRACLEHHRLPLLRTGDIQRPLHGEELSLMV
ncbi:hypothetical protein D3C73_990470 [compost metagenome]